MKEIKIIENLAKTIFKECSFTPEIWEIYMEDTTIIGELRERLDAISGLLMNYEDEKHKQDYLDGLIDEIDALVYKKEKRSK